MRILFHHRIRSKDGQYVHLSELVQAFRNCGHEVLLVGPRVIEEEGLGNGSGSIGWLRRWLPGWVSELLECLYALVAWPRLHRAIRRFRPDLIYERYNLFFPTGVWAARAAGVPLASEINAPLYEERSKEKAISLAALACRSQRYVWERADLLLPVSQVLADIVASGGGSPDRIRVLHNGVDTTRFRPADTEAAKRAVGLGGRLVLGFVGFVREWHGVDAIVRLLSTDRLPANAHLLIVGDGPARADLERLARRLGVDTRLTFTGVVQRESLPSWLAAFDIALQPAVTPYASPLKLIEYLAMGKAIVAPDEPNIRELLVHDSNAWLFRPRDPDALCEALCALAVDGERRRRLSQGALDTILAKKLTWEDNAKQIVEEGHRLTGSAATDPAFPVA